MIGLGFTGCQHIPSDWEKKYNGIIVDNFASGRSRVAILTNNDDCDRLIDEMVESRFPIQSFNFGWRRLVFDWSNPEDCWAGARLRWGDDFVELSPDNEFSPCFPEPCYGLIPPYLPVHVLKRPREQVVGAKLEQVFSTSICDFISSRVSCDFAPVVLHGNTLASHRRIILESRPVLAPQGFINRECAVCRTPLLAGIGLLLGYRMSDSLICESEHSTGHLGQQREYCLSVSVAQELRARFRHGYGLDPILDIHSPLGGRVLALLGKLKHINLRSS